MPTIYARHKSGFMITLNDVPRDKIDAGITWLLEHGYTPDPPIGDPWKRTPDGEPICPRHGVAMTQRQKQNDSWWSHRIITEDGEERYCRGYRTGRPEDGYLI